MNNWLCINNNIVEVIAYANQTFIETNEDILRGYQQIINLDLLPEPKPCVGSRFVDGKWIIKDVPDLRNTDFSNQDLTDRDFSYCDLTGCNFQGAIINGCRFDWVPPTFSLIGAIWQGITITHGPVLLENPHYYTLITNVAAFVGCTECPVGMPLLSTDAEKNSWDAQGTKPQLWWASVKVAYAAQVAAWSAP